MSAVRSPIQTPSLCPRRTLLVAAVLLAGLTVHAESPSQSFDARDVQLTLYVRRALSQDPDLARLNLFVSVRHGEATLSGAVPAWDIAERALKLVEKVEGIYFVRSSLRVSAARPEDALQDLLGGLADGGSGRDLLPVFEPAWEPNPGRSGILREPP